MLINLLSDRMSNWEHELSSKTQIGAQALSKVFWRIMWVINVPFELIPQDDVANPHIELDYFDQLTVHLLVLPELVDLLAHAGDYLALKNGWQIVLLHEDLCKAIQIKIWLILIPQEQITQPGTFNLQIKLNWDQLQIWLARICNHRPNAQRIFLRAHHFMINVRLAAG